VARAHARQLAVAAAGGERAGGEPTKRPGGRRQEGVALGDLEKADARLVDLGEGLDAPPGAVVFDLARMRCMIEGRLQDVEDPVRGRAARATLP